MRVSTSSSTPHFGVVRHDAKLVDTVEDSFTMLFSAIPQDAWRANHPPIICKTPSGKYRNSIFAFI